MGEGLRQDRLKSSFSEGRICILPSLIFTGWRYSQKVRERFCRGVDIVNEWTGKTVRWLIIPLTLIVVIEVTLRYVFNRPTIWAWDINVQLLGAMVILAGGYTLLQGGFISVDVFSTRLSPRARAITELATAVLFFISIIVLLWKTADAAWESMLIRETMMSYFRPPIYPFRVLMVVGVFLLLLQGIAKFIRDLGTATRRGQGEP